ncbi:carbamoyltransferase C-terminal domain-containing protein [Dickeya undicola]|uniref:carbamoyltransferase C-terminal domain-containing protein n=1 Tax=Dickeya undicola TaxID=1577887 RepID=UPI00067E5384|nr:carbamoyltransferase C-terminal domain-containing protein [Dickeya undicola]
MDTNNTTILLFDSARKNEIVKLTEISNVEILHPHTVKISSLLASELFSCSGKDLSRVVSASYLDALSQGYDNVRKRVAKKFRTCHVEAHAYSSAENEFSHALHTALTNFSDETEKPYILASVGHDFGRQRFPGSSTETIGVALLLKNNTIPGKTPAGNGNIEFIVREFDYPTRNNAGASDTIKGTSAAVVYLAGLAANLRDFLITLGNPHDRLALHAGMIYLSEAYQGLYLFENKALPQPLPQCWDLNVGRSTQVEAIFTLPSTSAGVKIGLAASFQGSIARTTRLTTIIDGQKIIGENGTLLISTEQLSQPGEHTIRLQVEGLFDRITFASQETLVTEITSSTPLIKADDDVIVGISASHDASACLLVNGKIRYGIQLERLTRIKHDGRNILDTTLAVDYCLSAAGLTYNDVNCFAYNIQAATPEYVGLNQPIHAADFTLFDPFSAKAVFASHHLCHAFAAWSGSKFNQGNVLVVDGSGGTVVGQDDLLCNGEEFSTYLNTGLHGIKPLLHVVSHYSFDQRGYQLVNREYSPSFNIRNGSFSLGEAYASVSQFVFNSWQASGKLMGLAPYGTPEYANEIAVETPSGLSYGYEWKQKFTEKKANPMDYANLAASVQAVLEKGIFSRLERFQITNNTPLVMTGGVSLNSVVNFKVRNHLKLKDFYLFPAQHDAGISIGAACAAYYKRHGKTLNDAFSHDYLGKIYHYRDIAFATNRFADRITLTPIDTAALAERLNAGQVIGYFSCNKGSEFGPRALGARSLLASPCSMDTWKFINKWVKFREDFRPFAPMVAAEQLNQYFDGDGEHKYMLEVLPVKKEYRDKLAAITHVDGTARVQTVSEHDNAEIHALLNAFGERSGFPVLLNTSFNVRGQPIVEEPQQAIEMLLSTHIDAVIFGDYIVELRKWELDEENLPGLLRLSPGCKLHSTLEKNEAKYWVTHDYQGMSKLISAQLYQSLTELLRLHYLADVQNAYAALPLTLRKQINKYIQLKCLTLAHDFSAGRNEH